MEEEKKKVLKLLQNLVLSSKGGVQIERLNRKSIVYSLLERTGSG